MVSVHNDRKHHTKKGENMKKIWDYLTPDEILDFYKQIESACEGTGHDFDEVINAMYELDLEDQNSPVEFVENWLQYNITDEYEENYEKDYCEEDSGNDYRTPVYAMME